MPDMEVHELMAKLHHVSKLLVDVPIDVMGTWRPDNVNWQAAGRSAVERLDQISRELNEVRAEVANKLSPFDVRERIAPEYYSKLGNSNAGG